MQKGASLMLLGATLMQKGARLMLLGAAMMQNGASLILLGAAFPEKGVMPELLGTGICVLSDCPAPEIIACVVLKPFWVSVNRLAVCYKTGIGDN